MCAWQAHTREPKSAETSCPMNLRTARYPKATTPMSRTYEQNPRRRARHNNSSHTIVYLFGAHIAALTAAPPQPFQRFHIARLVRGIGRRDTDLATALPTKHRCRSVVASSVGSVRPRAARQLIRKYCSVRIQQQRIGRADSYGGLSMPLLPRARAES